MAFCANCGKEVTEGENFCPSCGKPVVGATAGTKSAIEKVGNIHKCPSCGQPVESFQTRCSSCGHEFRSSKISGLIKEFTDQIIEYDEKISAEKQDLENSYSYKKVGWVFLNICTFLIPLIVRTIKRVFFPPAPRLTPMEENKKSFIENYAIPNNREDIMEFILFASTRVESVASNIGAASIGYANFWAKVWSDKCKQVSARAGVALSGDRETAMQINNLLNKPQQLIKKTKRKGLIKAGIFASILTIIIASIVIPASGIGIKVPAPRTLNSEDIYFSGSFDGYYKFIGGSFVPNTNGTEVTLTMEIEALKSFAADVEKEITRRKKELGWEKDNCQYELFSFNTKITIGNIETSDASAIKALLSMNAEETKRLNFVLSSYDTYDSSTGKKKKAITNLVNMPMISVTPSRIEYKLTNNTIHNRDENADYYEYIRF